MISMTARSRRYEVPTANASTLAGRQQRGFARLAFRVGTVVSHAADHYRSAVSGWWTALATSSQTEAVRLPPASAQAEKDGKFVLEGNLFEGGSRQVNAFGTRAQEPTKYPAGTVAERVTAAALREDGITP